MSLFVVVGDVDLDALFLVVDALEGHLLKVPVLEPAETNATKGTTVS